MYQALNLRDLYKVTSPLYKSKKDVGLKHDSRKYFRINKVVDEILNSAATL